MAFRFIHTADLHLDAPLKAIALRDKDLAAEVGAASRLAFSRIIDLCLSEEVAFLLIAGDLWDGAYSSTKTPRFLKQELLRLAAAGIECFIIRGNHDALARKISELELPDNTHLFGATPETLLRHYGGIPVALHGLSFREIHAPESLLPRYPAPKAGHLNIGLMHTSLGGSEGHDPYAPVSLGDLDGHGYDYWALGHIHRRAEYIGRSAIVMPGIPQGRDIGEAGAASVTLVEVGEDHRLTLSTRPVAALRFERLGVPCDGVSDWAGLLAALETAIREAARETRAEAHLVLRPRLTGETALHWRALRDHDRLLAEAQSYAAAQHGVWIDKLELALGAPAAERRGGGGLPAEVIGQILAGLPQDPGLRDLVKSAADELMGDLPADLRDLFGDTPEAFSQTIEALLAEGAALTIASLTDPEGEA